MRIKNVYHTLPPRCAGEDIHFICHYIWGFLLLSLLVSVATAGASLLMHCVYAVIVEVVAGWRSVLIAVLY